MRRIGGLFLKYPFYGSRQMVRQLRREGTAAGDIFGQTASIDVSDNCPSRANADQADSDTDGRGDRCDPKAMPWLLLLLDD